MNQQQQNQSRQVNLYYKEMYERRGRLKSFVLDLFFSISAYPRLILEVFIRRSLGRRYFSFSLCVFLFIVLAAIPFVFFGGAHGASYVITRHWSWYLFLAAFLVFGWRRAQEIKREPSIFDLGKFSLSAGSHLSIFNNFRIFGRLLTIREIEIYAEPLPFLIGGFILFLMQQWIGVIFMMSAVIYSFSYMSAYIKGDDFVQDIIDKLICNNQLHNSFVLQKRPEETQGFQFMGGGPSTFDMREKLVDAFFADEEEEAAGVN